MSSRGDALNAQQLTAVKIVDGPSLVVAGAGTGKTRVIVERILRLLADGVSPEHILALTFAEKAAGEMLDRVADVNTGAGLDATISTFNSFGGSILEEYGREWGLGSKLRLLGETGKLVFLREHLDEFELDYFSPVSHPDGQLDLLAGYVSLLKQQVITPETYQAYADKLPNTTEAERLEKHKHTELAAFFATYVRLCREKGVVDYDDQLYATLQLLQARPNILDNLQKRYLYILVDEFQDTNPMQSALIDLLAGPRRNVMVVGDDDQSIYGWRGATLSNILDFKQRYPEAQEVTLTTNYRSTQPILDAAYRLIQGNNPNRLEVINHLDKRLHAQTSGGLPPVVEHFADLDAELTWVCEDIRRRLDDGQAANGIAVLARRNHGVQKIHEALSLHDIPHSVAGLSNDLYQEPSVQQLLEVLKAVGDPLDDLALFHTLSGPVFSIEVSVLAEISALARRQQQSLEITIHAAVNPILASALDTLANWREQTQALSVGALAYAIITDSGWKQQLYEQAETDPVIFRQVQALSKYFVTLKEFENVADVASVQSYLTNLPTLKSAGSGFEDVSLDISDAQLNVLSVHRAKGLEWKTTYIIDCTEGSFPMRNFGGGTLSLPADLRFNSSAADDHLAEERRLMYVAVTRAQDELILTYSDRHGTGAIRKPSRFLAELTGTETTQTAITDPGQAELELFAPKTVVPAVPLPASFFHGDKLVLSVSQIVCFLRCPQDFYYLYVLQMPVPVEPALRYGTAIHEAIELLHKGMRHRQPPSLGELIDYVAANLPTTGYATLRSRERAHEQALQTMRTLYTHITTSPEPIATEQPFRVTLSDRPIEIIGRIDAIYQLPDGKEIRDFKTGTSVTDSAAAKRRASASTQLTLYALAWQLAHGELPALLTLDFVETGQIGSVKKQLKSLETLTTKLYAMADSLSAGLYPEGTDHKQCKHPGVGS